MEEVKEHAVGGEKSARVVLIFFFKIYFLPSLSAFPTFALANNSRREKDKRGSVQEQQSRNIYGARKLTSQIFLSKVLHFAEGENLLS